MIEAAGGLGWWLGLLGLVDVAAGPGGCRCWAWWMRLLGPGPGGVSSRTEKTVAKLLHRRYYDSDNDLQEKFLSAPKQPNSY